MSESGQASASAAEVYEALYVPGLFAELAQCVIAAAQIRPGQRVLDLACGTGALARAVADRVGENGRTAGVDVNKDMLHVARKRTPEIEWHKATAEALPMNDNSFDAVVCQFGLMYCPNREAALREMMRVLRPGGRLAVAVWDKIDNCPAWAAANRLFARILGDDSADESPNCLGDLQELQGLFTGAGISNAEIRTYEAMARFASVEEWIYADTRGWASPDEIGDDEYALLIREAQRELACFVADSQTVAFSMPAHIVTATKRHAPR